MYWTHLVILVSAALIQSASPALVRLGPTGHQLRVDDVEQIERIVAGVGGKPWVVVGGGQSRFLEDTRWFVSVFITPDHVAGAVRRGRIDGVVATLPAREAYGAAKTWQKVDTRTYAQIAVAGTDPSALTDRRDLNRPFSVAESITDEELLSVVAFVRTSPRLNGDTGPGASVFHVVQGRWPISSMTRTAGDTVDVSLQDNASENEFQHAVLRRSGQQWVVAKLYLVIVD